MGYGIISPGGYIFGFFPRVTHQIRQGRETFAGPYPPGEAFVGASVWLQKSPIGFFGGTFGDNG